MFGECHAHVFMDAVNYRQAVNRHKEGVDESVIHAHFKEYQKRGITFVRDGGDRLGVSKRAREIAPEYDITYHTPIFAIHKNGHYGGIVGFGFDTMKEYAELVKKVRQESGDFIKIMTTGLMDFDTDGSITGEALKREEVFEMIHIAHEEGFSVMSHTNGNQAVIDVAEAGVDSVEHGNFLNEEALCALKESQAVWVPTTTVVPNMIGCGRFRDELLVDLYERDKVSIRKGFDMGVRFALGSDAGAYRVFHGQGLLDELSRFEEIVPDKRALYERLSEGEKIIREKF